MLCQINTNYVRIFHRMDSFVFVDTSLLRWAGGVHTSLFNEELESGTRIFGLEKKWDIWGNLEPESGSETR
jgi:hypothetical protein